MATGAQEPLAGFAELYVYWRSLCMCCPEGCEICRPSKKSPLVKGYGVTSFIQDEPNAFLFSPNEDGLGEERIIPADSLDVDSHFEG